MHPLPRSERAFEAKRPTTRLVLEADAGRTPRPSPSDELELLERVVQGDQAAWRSFHRRFRGLVFACAAKASASMRVQLEPDELADVVQETFLRMVSRDYRRLRSYRPDKGASVGSWIGIITFSATKDFVRRRARRAHARADPVELDGLPSLAEGPDAGLERRDEWRRLEAALRALSAREQELVERLFVEQLEPTETARRMGISASTVYSKKSKLAAKLAKQLRASD